MLRKKTWIEAIADESIGKMDFKEIRELVGWADPEPKRFGKIEWTVTLADEGSFYTTKSQSEALIIAELNEILVLLLRGKKNVKR